jgi:hypothetical protein
LSSPPPEPGPVGGADPREADDGPGGAFAGPVIALAAVVGLIAALLLIGGRSDHHSPAPNAATGALTEPSPTAHHHRAATPSPSTHRSSPPSRAATSNTRPASHRAKPARAARPTPSVSSHHRSGGSATTGSGGGSVFPTEPVTVLNNSRIYHLAAQVAAEVRDRGWPIARVGNFTGRLPQTTLFYLPGQYGVARALAADFGGITSLQPRPRWLPGSGLTLVLTRYWVS